MIGFFGGKEIQIWGLVVRQKREKTLTYWVINDQCSDLREFERHLEKRGVWVAPRDSSPSPQRARVVLGVGQCIFPNHSCDLSRILIKLNVTDNQNVSIISGSGVGKS